jgi:hypothetical protein
MATQSLIDSTASPAWPKYGVSDADFQQLRHSLTDRRQLRSLAKSRLAFTGISRYCVLYLDHGRERRSPWFYSKPRAQQARESMARRYGNGNTILHVD